MNPDVQTPYSASTPVEDLPVIDLEVALARVGGDQELLRELAGLFLEEAPRMLAEIEKATARRDGKAVESAAHGLKGSAANFGAQATVEAAFRLEQLGREHKQTEFASALATLQVQLSSLNQQLSVL